MDMLRHLKSCRIIIIIINNAVHDITGHDCCVDTGEHHE